MKKFCLNGGRELLMNTRLDQDLYDTIPNSKCKCCRNPVVGSYHNKLGMLYCVRCNMTLPAWMVLYGN